MTTANTHPATPTSPDQKRRRNLILLTTACLLGAIAYGLYWFFVARFHVDTDNAYVQGNIVQITSQVGGTVVAIEANDTDNVKAGQLLVRLDPVDARVALDQAEAQLAQTVREVRATFATNKTLAATVDARQADVTRSETDSARWRADLGRRQGLVDGGAVSVEELQHLQTSIANARSAQLAASAGLAEAREQLLKNETMTEGTSVETHPRVLAAAAKYREAWLAFKRSDIASPVAGAVARRSVQVGQRIASGVPMMAIVPLDELWVDANFKESQLSSLRVGQSAQLTADVYGQRTEYRGHIAGLGAGTGSAFSLLPAQNATGNWIKIVQRVPVRIVLDAAEVAKHPLRVGLSMEVRVDVHDQSGASVAEARPNEPVASTSIFSELDKGADERVNAIVSANLGRHVSLKRAG
ncbi:MAG: putative multidrug resistance protein [Proteobacteria bacterium]|nr:putative multidrug resistance protein [Pseudomonadota bacterium]